MVLSFLEGESHSEACIKPVTYLDAAQYIMVACGAKMVLVSSIGPKRTEGPT
jgi:hypothetical protein